MPSPVVPVTVKLPAAGLPSLPTVMELDPPPPPLMPSVPLTLPARLMACAPAPSAEMPTPGVVLVMVLPAASLRVAAPTRLAPWVTEAATIPSPMVVVPVTCRPPAVSIVPVKVSAPPPTMIFDVPEPWTAPAKVPAAFDRVRLWTEPSWIALEADVLSSEVMVWSPAFSLNWPVPVRITSLEAAITSLWARPPRVRVDAVSTVVVPV